ncbi:ACT domain-containing protein ACR6-like [Zingiber officinale]|uniref:ACT domain-containing protein ACR6-like n=1 Tax=Zingiber officinale TaxID=94328 RepID=UPI001C4C09DF|nr:ACT domain-containing protein ACR6-like [Zingiber officinale]
MSFGFYKTSSEIQEEHEKLFVFMNPPRITVDDTSCSKTTLIKVHSANRQGSLLEVARVLVDLKLVIKRAYICSDGEWFMDVFYVVDQEGNKISDRGFECTISMEQSLEEGELHRRPASVDVQGAGKLTSIELVGLDRPGLLSEISAVLTDLQCNIVAADLQTHNSKVASVIHVTDAATGGPVAESDRLSKIRHLLGSVLRGSARTTSASSSTPTSDERRMLQLMLHDDDGASGIEGDPEPSPVTVTVEDYVGKEFTVVNVRCKNLPDLIFHTVCTLTHMQFVVFHGAVVAEGPEAHQEYYIRKENGIPFISEEERIQLANCLEAAIERGDTKGMRLELCCDDRPGLLSDVTRVFRENGLSVLRAQALTRGTRAMNYFYVVDASGNAVGASRAVDAARREIGLAFLHVRDDAGSRWSTESVAKAKPEEGGAVKEECSVKSIVKGSLLQLFTNVSSGMRAARNMLRM